MKMEVIMSKLLKILLLGISLSTATQVHSAGAFRKFGASIGRFALDTCKSPQRILKIYLGATVLLEVTADLQGPKLEIDEMEKYVSISTEARGKIKKLLKDHHGIDVNVLSIPKDLLLAGAGKNIIVGKCTVPAVNRALSSWGTFLTSPSLWFARAPFNIHQSKVCEAVVLHEGLRAKEHHLSLALLANGGFLAGVSALSNKLPQRLKPLGVGGLLAGALLLDSKFDRYLQTRADIYSSKDPQHLEAFIKELEQADRQIADHEFVENDVSKEDYDKWRDLIYFVRQDAYCPSPYQRAQDLKEQVEKLRKEQKEIKEQVKVLRTQEE
jgi:hypothetical protein